MTSNMLTMATILLAALMVSDSARIRQSKTDRVSEDGAVSAAVGAKAKATGRVLPPSTVRKQSGADAVEAEQGQRFVGHVKSWTDGWGFLTSHEVEGDIMVHWLQNPELGGSLCVGEQVIFEVTSGTDGRPRAKNARGSHKTGILATYKNGRGHIKSPSLPEKLYCGETDNPAIKQQSISAGDVVRFEVSTNTTNGKSKAVNTCILAKHQSEMVGQHCIGTVRSWRGDWGFASSEKFTGWIMIGRQQLQASGLHWLHVGAPLQFEVSHNKDGKYEAINLSSPFGPSPSIPLAAANLDGKMIGTVTTFRGNWGFIQSDQHPGDIYVSAMEAHGPLKVGEKVAFDFNIIEDRNHNGARALNVMRLGGAAGRVHTQPSSRMRAYLPQITPTPFYRTGYANTPGPKIWGTMVSVQDTWGWLRTVAVESDVFLGMRDNPQLSELPAVGDMLRFQLSVDPKSRRYKAISAVSVATRLSGTRVQGIVTKVKDGPWGFATSEGVEGDVMIGSRNLIDSGIKTIHRGDVLEYELSPGQRGYEALNIRAVSVN